MKKTTIPAKTIPSFDPASGKDFLKALMNVNTDSKDKGATII